ncbi:MAG: TAXI family TRAP transporter solute-binding subunit [Calothrix sp. FI2-JRJ7]|jgi:TRAP transporter TAXI family solute receptor|nr:TAXI family TRAP transporter solute-binding subunit [Calothrix sp. FI2-JRJ7]
MKLPVQRVVWLGIGLIIILGVGWYWNQPKCLRIAAGRSGGDAHNFALLMRKFLPLYSNNKICITLVETDGTQENLEKLENKQADLATAQADILIMKNLPSLAPLNALVWNPSPQKQLNDAQIVSLLFPDMYQLVVRNDSDIKSVSDLAKDKKVAMPPREGGQIESFAFLMQYYALVTGKQQLVKLVEVGNKIEDVKNALCNQKQIDAIFYVRAIDNDNIREILTQCGRLISIDQAAAMTIKNPYLQQAEIPEGAYRGGGNPIPSSGVDNKQKLTTVSTPRLLLAHKDADKEKIRAITQILYDYRQEFIKQMPLLANMSPPDSMKSRIGLPIHAGAQAYYDREKPSWLERYSESLGFIITLASIGLSGFLWLTQRFEQIRKNKADDYIREVNSLMDAEDCIQAVIAYLNAEQLNNTQQLKIFKDTITEKSAKILVEKRIAELACQKNLISNESLISFGKTLRKVINAIEKLSVNVSEEILNDVLQKATYIVANWQNEPINILQRLLRVSSADELRKTEKNKLNHQNLDDVLQKVKIPVGKQQALQLSDATKFLESEILEIRRDLNAIFKRAVNALVEERISQESFQSFRVIWQVAADGIKQENHRLP